MSLNVGIDLVSVAEIDDAIRLHGDRYLNRIYTDEERRDCAAEPHRLAARFAAKEAAMKALRRGDEPIPWTAIGVRRDARGHPSLELTGEAATLAGARGVSTLELSLSHDGGYAVAIVLAVGDGAPL